MQIRISLNVVTRQKINGDMVTVAIQPSKNLPIDGKAHLAATVLGRPMISLTGMIAKGGLMYRGSLNDMPGQLKESIDRAQRKFGRTAIDLSALLAGRLNSPEKTTEVTPLLGAPVDLSENKYRTGRVKNKEHLDNLIASGKARFSLQHADPRTQRATDADIEKAFAAIEQSLGDSVKVATKNFFTEGYSGRWTKKSKRNLIELALNGDVQGTAYHESLHEFFDMLGKHGAQNVKDLIERVSTNRIVLRQLEKLLKDQRRFKKIRQVITDKIQCVSMRGGRQDAACM